MSDLRVGIGVDAHAFSDEAVLVVGGVGFPDEPGLAGHSDGDVVAHALVDAVLGAAGLGDIGTFFPSDDPEWAGASSLVFLERAMAAVREAGFELVNADCVVVGERPRIGPVRAEMEARLAGALGVEAAASRCGRRRPTGSASRAAARAWRRRRSRCSSASSPAARSSVHPVRRAAIKVRGSPGAGFCSAGEPDGALVDRRPGRRARARRRPRRRARPRPGAARRPCAGRGPAAAGRSPRMGPASAAARSGGRARGRRRPGGTRRSGARGRGRPSRRDP